MPRRLKLSECQFSCTYVRFLGHVISEHWVAFDPRKVVAVAEWATPTSCTNVCCFVGLANYYSKFVLHLSALEAPLTALCSPCATFRWGSAEQGSFDTLKAVLVSAPVLQVWDPALHTHLLTDASKLAVFAILDSGLWSSLTTLALTTRCFQVAQADAAQADVPSAPLWGCWL